jgi:predicted ATP-dependent protease
MTISMNSPTSVDSGKLKTAPLPRELSPEEVDTGPIEGLEFDNTGRLEPLDEIVGQDRAMAAIEVGLGISQDGYNIFVAGLTGTGKMGTIRKSLQKRLDISTVPDDWVYVNNFDNPDEPWAIKLPPGKAKRLQKDMTRLVERLKEALPKAFHQQDFGREKEQLSERYQNRIEQQAEQIRSRAKEQGFQAVFSGAGGVAFVPLIEGKPAEKTEQIEQLPEEEKKRIAEGEKELSKEIIRMTQQQQEMMESLSEEVRDIERQFALYVVKPMIDAIKSSYQDSQRLLEYLDRAAEHILDNLSDFKEKPRGPHAVGPLEAMMGADSDPKFLEYQVNVVVDHSESETAPIVIEEAPTYRNLFGSIDRTVDRWGRLATNFTQIKPGSLLRANGGYLVFNIEDALSEPFVYKNLKRALKSGYVQLETYNPWLPFSTGGLRPEPIPITTKVVVIGKPILYYLLRFYDDEFASIFKIKADFGTEMDRSGKHELLYARFIATLSKDEGLRPLSRDAVEEVIRFGSKQVAGKNKLLTRFSEVADLLRESDYFAKIEGSNLVQLAHVRKALENRIYRSDRIAEKIRELIDEGILLVDTEGSKIGQVNGLGIINLGDYAFGKPNRVTASVGIGSDGLINIEREAKLSGSTHDKGMLILSGFLRNKYGRQRPLSLSASICLEQSYGGVEGDSASSTELFALLSNLAQVPLRQDIAVTGSVNQWGQIQAVGGVNEKIEGFFDVCRVAGLTSKQGVCIPASNVRNLVLRHDVRQAIADGQFHVYPIEDVDQGLELLTGNKAGSISEEGTLHWLIDRHLDDMARALHRFAAVREGRLISPAPPPAEAPGPPKTPDEQP